MNGKITQQNPIVSRNGWTESTEKCSFPARFRFLSPHSWSLADQHVWLIVCVCKNPILYVHSSIFPSTLSFENLPAGTLRCKPHRTLTRTLPRKSMQRFSRFAKECHKYYLPAEFVHFHRFDDHRFHFEKLQQPLPVPVAFLPDAALLAMLPGKFFFPFKWFEGRAGREIKDNRKRWRKAKVVWKMMIGKLAIVSLERLPVFSSRNAPDNIANRYKAKGKRTYVSRWTGRKSSSGDASFEEPTLVSIRKGFRVRVCQQTALWLCVIRELHAKVHCKHYLANASIWIN